MKTIVFIILLFLNLIGNAQSVPVLKFPDVEKQVHPVDTVIVINFWATWCKPCVEELPYFEAAIGQFKDSPVKFLFVSLDFRRELESRLIPFVEGRKIKPMVVLLDDPDYNSWIPKVDSTFSGGIPATLIIDNRNGKRRFYERPFEKEELMNTINEVLNGTKK